MLFPTNRFLALRSKRNLKGLPWNSISFDHIVIGIGGLQRKIANALEEIVSDPISPWAGPLSPGCGGIGALVEEKPLLSRSAEFVLFHNIVSHFPR